MRSRFMTALFALTSILFVHHSSAENRGLVVETTIWQQLDIPVCWEDFSDSSPAHRDWVKNAVERTWDAVSAVNFHGWGECSVSSEGVRIDVRDNSDGVFTAGLGRQLNGRVNGMVLNFTFNNWSPDCKKSLKFCIDGIAVHEFGHALGFEHEQNRDDTPASCTEPSGSTNTDPTTEIGPWDEESVMNYCNDIYNGGGVLSDGDVEMVRTYYPAPILQAGDWYSRYGSATLQSHNTSDSVFEVHFEEDREILNYEYIDANVRVLLIDPAGKFTRKTIYNTQGSYLIQDAAPGRYDLRLTTCFIEEGDDDFYGSGMPYWQCSRYSRTLIEVH